MSKILITGKTGQGKTVLAKRLVKKYKALGIGALVLTPKLDHREWDTPFVYGDKDKFLRIIKQNVRKLIVVDEVEDILGKCQSKDDAKYKWVTTMSREWGHSVILIAQRVQQMSTTMRDQCNVKYLFRSSYSDAKMFAAEYGPRMNELYTMPQFHFLAVNDNSNEIKRMKVQL